MMLKVVVAPLSPSEIDKLDVMGKFNSELRFPQYLQSAIFVGANVVADVFCATLCARSPKIRETTSDLFTWASFFNGMNFN